MGSFSGLGTYVWPIWGVLAVLALVAIGFFIRSESRVFAKRDRHRPWLLLRLATIPIALLAAVAVFLPARAVRGPEALGAFYLLLFTAAPLVYFGLHWMVGKIVGLPARDSASIGASGLAILIVPLLAAQFAHPYVFLLARAMQEGSRALTKDKPAPHSVAAQQRFMLPEAGEVWTEHWLVPAGTTIEQIEFELNGRFVPAEGGSSGYLCRSGQDVHVLWQAAVAPPKWRVHWRTEGGGAARSVWTSTPPQTPAVPFEIQWRPEGFAVPARIPRGIVALGRRFPDGRETSDTLNAVPFMPGRPPPDNCLPLEYRNPNAAQELPLVAVTFLIWRVDTQQHIRPTFRRPAEPALTGAPAEAATDAPLPAKQ